MEPDDPHLAAQYHGQAEFLTGLVRFRQNRPEAALQAFRKAAELDPQNEWIWFYSAESYRLLGQSAEAIRAYSACTEINPDHSRALQWLQRLQAATSSN